MAKTDKTRQVETVLSVEQENAVEILLTGASDREVAEAVGVARQTVTEWRNNNMAFVAALNRRREDVWGEGTDRLRSLVARAVDVLADNLTSEDPKAQLAAAVHVLRCCGLYGANLKPDGPTNENAALSANLFKNLF